MTIDLTSLPARARGAVIFDLDGTLTRPYLDFDAIRAELGLPPGPILEALARMPEEQRRQAEVVLHRHEHLAALESELQDGARQVLEELAAAGWATAILTRNSRSSAQMVLDLHGLRVDRLYTREDGEIKPSPAPVLELCRGLGVAPSSSWVVGDYLYDLQCGKAAGTRTVLMLGDRELPDYAQLADHVVARLTELPGVIARDAPWL